jgi:hypothetical protein
MGSAMVQSPPLARVQLAALGTSVSATWRAGAADSTKPTPVISCPPSVPPTYQNNTPMAFSGTLSTPRSVVPLTELD